MQRDLTRLAREHFDLVVIGGGITGACIAHDAALRGLRVALVERNDFGGYTSSASSKLLHGGIRYLPKGQLWKVRESAREQAIFQHLAPHLTRWIPFLVPTDSSGLARGRMAMKAAMLIYRGCRAGLDNLIRDRDKKPPSPAFLSAGEALSQVPLLEAIPGLTGAQVLYESHMHSSERMTLAFIKTAVRNGACVANYTAVTDLLCRDGRVQGVRVRDRQTSETFSIQARLVVNAAGPYVQAVNRTIPSLRLRHPLTGFSRGVHLVTRQVEPRYALALTTRKKTEGFITRGGRHFFIIPWRDHSLIGTTNVPLREELDSIRVTRQDIHDFLQDINGALPDVDLTWDDVRFAFTGVYPIIAREIKPDTYQGTGEFQIIDHAVRDGVEGIITALGAKFTTARKVAEKTVDRAMARLGTADPGCTTHSTPLAEGRISSLRNFVEECCQQYGDMVSASDVRHLVRYHGTETGTLIGSGRKVGLLNRLAEESPVLEIEVVHAVREEMAMRLEDVVFRRTGLGTTGCPSMAVLRRCAELMAGPLSWSDEEIRSQIQTVQKKYRWS